MTSQTNVASLAAHRHRDSRALLLYLLRRLDMGDLHGLVVQSLGPRGKERSHITGEYKNDRPKAMAAMLTLSIRMTAEHGGFQDSSY